MYSEDAQIKKNIFSGCSDVQNRNVRTGWKIDSII